MLQVENVDKETQVNAAFISIYLLLPKTKLQNKIKFNVYLQSSDVLLSGECRRRTRKPKPKSKCQTKAEV